jgi:hypothetical protein
MNTKKILIGAGIGAILAWGWWKYSKSKGKDHVSEDMDDSQRLAMDDFPDATPIGDTVEDGMKTPELEVQEELPQEAVEEAIEETMPVAQTRPVAIDKPLILIKQEPVSIRPAIQQVEAQPIMQSVSRIGTPISVRSLSLSRFSGMDGGDFDGGGNFIEVGDGITDLD